MRTRDQEVALWTWLTPSVVMKRLAVARDQVIGLINDGELDAIDVGRGDKPVYRIHPDSVSAFEARRKVKSDAA
jgi:hypothetical protein